MHGAVRKVFHHADDFIIYCIVEPDLRYRCADYFTDRLSKCPDARLVYDHRIAVVQITYLEIATGHKLQLECPGEIEFYIQLAPLQFFVTEFGKFYFCSNPAEVIQSRQMIGHSYKLNVGILEDRALEFCKPILLCYAAKSDGQDLAALLIKLRCF